MRSGTERAVLLAMSDRAPNSHPLPRRGYLGFGVDAVPAPLELSHEGEERWIISEVDSSGLGDTSRPIDHQLKVGDDLIVINGERIPSLARLRAIAASVTPHSACSVRVLRGGESLELTLTAQTMPIERLSDGRVELGQVDWAYQGENFRLRAIWTHPNNQLTKAAVWLLPSAAWITQESPLDPLDPTFQLIDHLTAHGISTLRIDRSGLGDSEGPHASTLDFDAELSMWEAGCRYFIAGTKGVRRCLFGRSLGGILAPLIARKQPIDAIAVWGTSSLNWHEASLESVRYQRMLKGQSGAALERAVHSIEQLQRLIYLDGLSPAAARIAHPELAQISASEYQGALAYGRNYLFFHQLQQQDLRAAWSHFRGDLLAVHAQYDIVVPEMALRRLAQSASGRSQFVSLQGVDHFMHERTSLAEAIAVPWGGQFSREAERDLTAFFSSTESPPTE